MVTKMILKNKVLHLKESSKELNHHDCKWYTFKAGQTVPEHLVNLAKAHGAEFEEPVVKEEPKKSVVKKKLFKKKASKK